MGDSEYFNPADSTARLVELHARADEDSMAEADRINTEVSDRLEERDQRAAADAEHADAEQRERDDLAEQQRQRREAGAPVTEPGNDPANWPTPGTQPEAPRG